MSTEFDLVQGYIRDRKAHLRGCLGQARGQLAAARGEYALKPTAQRKAVLIRALANLEIAEAFSDTMKTIR